MIGAGLHWKNADDLVENQARIIDVIPSNGHAGDFVLIEYFEWITGSPSTRRLLSLLELATSQWVIYESVEAMTDHYEHVDEPRIAHRERQ